MIKISFCMRRLPHMSREAFQTYWRDKHPMAVPPEAIPTLGVKRYIQVHTLDTSARELVVGPRTGLEEPLDGIGELWVESLEVLERDWSTDKAKEILRAFFEDEKNFIDGRDRPSSCPRNSSSFHRRGTESHTTRDSSVQAYRTIFGGGLPGRVRLRTVA